MNVNEYVEQYTSREWVQSRAAVAVAACAAALASLVSIIQLYRHLRHYTRPAVQSYIVRIITIVPAYAISSAISLQLGPGQGEYLSFVVSVYEAFIIYSLVSLIMEYSGGELDCVYGIENEPPLKLPFPMCLAKPRQRDARLIRSCKRGVLQFVVVKPVMAIVDVAAFACGVYESAPFQVVEGIIYNTSYCLSLYCLIVLFYATKNLISRFRPGR